MLLPWERRTMLLSGESWCWWWICHQVCVAMAPLRRLLNWLMRRFNGLAPLLPGGPVLPAYVGAFPSYVSQSPPRQTMGSLTGWISLGRRKGRALTQMCLRLSASVFSQLSRWSPSRKRLHWRVTQKCQRCFPTRERKKEKPSQRYALHWKVWGDTVFRHSDCFLWHSRQLYKVKFHYLSTEMNNHRVMWLQLGAFI